MVFFLYATAYPHPGSLLCRICPGWRMHCFSTTWSNADNGTNGDPDAADHDAHIGHPIPYAGNWYIAGISLQHLISSRSDRSGATSLFTLRMENDQKVLQCLKNPPETVSNTSTTTVVPTPCLPGTGTDGTCPVILLKTDRDTGLSGSGNTEAGWDRSIQQTGDGGYIVSGSRKADVSPGHGAEDMWVVKLNPAGVIQWQKVLGGRDRDESFSIRQTTDDGYILIGSTDSDNSGDVGPNHGRSDIWVVKLSPAGGIQWQKVLGGAGYDTGRSIWQTSDGGYILTGTTESDMSGDVGPNHGGSDIWVVKLNPAGGILWQKVLGGSRL